MREEQDESAETNEQVDEPFDLRPIAEDHIDYIPVVAHVTAKSDETPVEAADNDEDERESVQ